MRKEALVLGASAVARIVQTVKYYEWAYGNIVEADTEIGILGEYVVGSALGCLTRRRSVFGTYDLTLKSGATIEVKTTCRKNPQSRGRPPEWRWDIENQKRVLTEGRNVADWWVFLKVEFPEKAAQSRLFNPFDERWWTAYLVAGKDLLATGVKVRVSEATLRRCQAVTCKLSGLKDALARPGKV